MRTTLDIDDSLLKQAKILAAREHTTLTRIVEEGLSARLRALRPSPPAKGKGKLPVYAGKGGLCKGVKDSVSNKALLDAADEVDDRK